MAFQSGTQVDPRLLDYSGYAQGITNAAAINAAALQQIGSDIIEAKEKAETKKNTVKLMSGMLKNVPELASLTGMDMVENATDADYTKAATQLFDSFGEDVSKQVTLLALTSMFEDDDDDDVDPTTVMKFQEMAEQNPMIKLGPQGQLMRQTADKGSIFNPIDLLIRAPFYGKELNIFGDDPFITIPETDPLIKNIKGGKELQASRSYDPLGADEVVD